MKKMLIAWTILGVVLFTNLALARPGPYPVSYTETIQMPLSEFNDWSKANYLLGFSGKNVIVLEIQTVVIDNQPWVVIFLQRINTMVKSNDR